MILFVALCRARRAFMENSNPTRAVPMYRALPDRDRWVVTGPGLPIPPHHFYAHMHDAQAAASQCSLAHESGQAAGEVLGESRSNPVRTI